MVAKYRQLEAGEPAPWFTQEATSNPQFSFSTAGGRYIVLGFVGTASDERGRQMVAFVEGQRALFDDDKITFFGVSADPQDRALARMEQKLPGIRHFWDFDLQISRLYGALPAEPEPGAGYRRFWIVLDPTMRVRKLVPARADSGDEQELVAYLAALPPVDRFAGFRIQAPVLVLPDVFEPEVCERLMDIHRREGGRETGAMRDVDGKTVEVVDFAHKRRTDVFVEDEQLIADLRGRIARRVVPEIQKVHHFKVTRMERYLIACYDSETGGHFRAHRDNTTKGTAHRRFAVSINLNAEFEGGEVSFPEYGPQSFKPPPGGAVVFSCSLLHAVSRVTEGQRYAFLPFLYDDEAARIRAENNQFLGENVGQYKAQRPSA